jgi:hypothetical protein
MSGAVSFFLYFPTKSAARQAASELASDGYTVTLRLGAMGSGWLVLGERENIRSGTELTQAEERLTSLASTLEGEYDGYERDVSTS